MKYIRITSVLVFALLLSLLSTETSLAVLNRTKPEGAKLALVVGIEHYDDSSPGAPSSGAILDAAAVAHSLKAAGFDTRLLIDPNYEDLSAAISAFAETAADADHAVLYFAGRTGLGDTGLTLVPAGSGQGASNASDAAIIASESIYAALAASKKGAMLFIDDCCAPDGIVGSFETLLADRLANVVLDHEFAAPSLVLAFSEVARVNNGQEPGHSSPFAAAVSTAFAKDWPAVPAMLARLDEEGASETQVNGQAPFPLILSFWLSARYPEGKTLFAR